MKEVVLSERQLLLRKEFLDGLSHIENTIAMDYDPSDGNSVSETLAEVGRYAAYCGRIMELATIIRGEAYKQVAIMIMDDPKLSAAKQAVQNMYTAGLLKEYNGIYDRAEKSCKSFDKYLEQLRSQLSWCREQLNKRVGMD